MSLNRSFGDENEVSKYKENKRVLLSSIKTQPYDN